jgi:hypothetical protein
MINNLDKILNNGFAIYAVVLSAYIICMIVNAIINEKLDSMQRHPSKIGFSLVLMGFFGTPILLLFLAGLTFYKKSRR